MSDIRVVRIYPHSPAKVWRALTEPALMSLWGMRPEGYAPSVGTRFKLVGQPNFAWRGFVECEVLEAREPSILRYRWDDDGKTQPTQVTYTLAPTPGGTRLTVDHSGFRGVGGYVFARLMMGPGWRKRLGESIPAVLASLREETPR